MVSISGGQFFMGAPETEVESLDSERPQHFVRVNPFFIGNYLVTQEQWLMVSELPKVNHKLHPNCSWVKEVKCPVDEFPGGKLWSSAIACLNILDGNTVYPVKRSGNMHVELALQPRSTLGRR